MTGAKNPMINEYANGLDEAFQQYRSELSELERVKLSQRVALAFELIEHDSEVASRILGAMMLANKTTINLRKDIAKCTHLTA